MKEDWERDLLSYEMWPDGVDSDLSEKLEALRLARYPKSGVEFRTNEFEYWTVNVISNLLTQLDYLTDRVITLENDD